MAIALVQKSASVGTGGAGTLPANSTAGNLLVAHVNYGLTPSVPSGWVKAVGDTTNKVWIYYYENNPGGLSSFTFSGQVVITEWSGVATSGSLDTTGINSAASSPVTATTSGNVSVANSLAVGCVAEGDSKSTTTTIAAGTGWTDQLDNGSTSDTNHTLASSQLNPTVGATLSEQGSSTTMNLTALGVAVAVFKPAGTETYPVPHMTVNPLVCM